MASSNDSAGRAQGFAGAVAGLSLPDVIQLNGSNRFSGCITVQYGEKTGLVFFRDGEIVHAEMDGRSGEEAFYGIMEWQSGRFSLQPNVATTSRSIQKSAQHLLIEAHRVIDERRAGRPAAPPEDPARQGSVRAALQRVRGLPAVDYVVVIGKDGTCVEDTSFEGESLGGRAAFVRLIGDKLGAVFKAGAMHAAAVQGSSRHILVLAAKSHYLGVAIRGEVEIGAVESEVRRVLGAR